MYRITFNKERFKEVVNEVGEEFTNGIKKGLPEVSIKGSDKVLIGKIAKEMVTSVN